MHFNLQFYCSAIESGKSHGLFFFLDVGSNLWEISLRSKSYGGYFICDIFFFCFREVCSLSDHCELEVEEDDVLLEK